MSKNMPGAKIFDAENMPSWLADLYAVSINMIFAHLRGAKTK